MKLLNIATAVTAAILLSGCAGAAFNRLTVTQNRYVTAGQELIDLKTAHEEGVINDTEYAQAKRDVLGSIKPTDFKID